MQKEPLAENSAKTALTLRRGEGKREEATAGEVPGITASTEVGHISSSADVVHRGNKHDVAPGLPFIKRAEADGARSLRRLDDEGECNPESAVHNRSESCYRNSVDGSRVQGHSHEPRESIPDVAVESIPTKRKEGEKRKSITLRTAETLVEDLLSGAQALGAREEQGVGKGGVGEGRMEEKRSNTTKQARSGVFAEPAWIQGYDPTHDCYYFYHIPTSESTWHKPD